MLWKCCKNIVDITLFFLKISPQISTTIIYLFLSSHFPQWHCHNSYKFFFFFSLCALHTYFILGQQELGRERDRDWDREWEEGGLNKRKQLMSSDQWSLDPLGYGHVSSLGHVSVSQRVQCSLALDISYSPSQESSYCMPTSNVYYGPRQNKIVSIMRTLK